MPEGAVGGSRWATEKGPGSQEKGSGASPRGLGESPEAFRAGVWSNQCVQEARLT